MDTTPQPAPATAPAKPALSAADLLRLVRYYLQDWKWLLVLTPALAALGWAGFYWRASKQKSTYTATLTFMLSEETNNKSSFLDGLLGMSGGGTMVDLNFAKLEELMTTKKLMHLALFRRKTVEGKEDFLINHYLRLFLYCETCAGKKDDPYYFSTDSIAPTDRKANIVFSKVHRNITRGALNKFNSPAGIFNINFTSESEEFSYEFIRAFFEMLDRYYYEKSIEKQKDLYEATVRRVDSLYNEMKNAEGRLIGFKDENSFAAVGTHTSTISAQFLSRQLQLATESYFSARKNMEAAKVSLDQQAPLMQPIDEPTYPLTANIPDPSSSARLGAIIGAVLSVFAVAGLRFAWDLWQRFRGKGKTASA